MYPANAPLTPVPEGNKVGGMWADTGGIACLLEAAFQRDTIMIPAAPQGRNDDEPLPLDLWRPQACMVLGRGSGKCPNLRGDMAGT